MKEVRINNLKELSRWVKDFLSRYSAQEKATLITLSGDLGAGKTTFVQHAAEYFGITETLTSPTFVILKEYVIPKASSFDYLIHIDAYRLQNKEELESLGWKQLVTNPKNIIFLEWPEMVHGIDFPPFTALKLSHAEHDSRIIEIQ